MKLSKLTFVVTVLLLLAGTVSYAQIPFTQDDDPLLERNDKFAELNEIKRDLADEYLDILDELADIVEDYSEYQLELSSADRRNHPLPLDRLKLGLKKGTYAEQHELLKDDINVGINSLNGTAQECSEASGIKNPRCCRVVRNLRRELEIVSDRLEEYSTTIKMHQKWSSEMFEYVREAMKHYQVIQVEIPEIELMEDEIKIITSLSMKHNTEAIKIYLHSLDLERLQMLEDIEDLDTLLNMEELSDMIEELSVSISMVPHGTNIAPKVYIIPTPIRPPAPLPNEIKKRYMIGTHKGKGGTKKIKSGKLEVSDISKAIKVIDPLGDIEIVGWNQDMVMAGLSIEVNSDKKENETKFIEQTDLIISYTNHGYSVTVDYPRMKNPNTEIISSILAVKIPYDQALECQNAYGRVLISNHEGSLKFNGDKSEVSFSNIGGSVLAFNKQGSLSFMNVSGTIRADNHYGPIYATDCEADLDLRNEYSQIELTGCTGDVKIANSGGVNINDHVGNADIKSSHGLIELDNIEGDVIVVNEYQPIILRQINGTTKVENNHSLVTLEGLRGMVIAKTTDGKIHGSRLTGPFELVADNGDINLILDGSYSGSSTVHASYGKIDLDIRAGSDLFLAAETIDGRIRSRIPAKIIRGNKKETLSHIFGTGADSVSVTGDKAAIVISTSR